MQVVCVALYTESVSLEAMLTGAPGVELEHVGNLVPAVAVLGLDDGFERGTVVKTSDVVGHHVRERLAVRRRRAQDHIVPLVRMLV